MTTKDEVRTCQANVDDKDSEESRPCMRKVKTGSVYCWQHSSRFSRSYGNRSTLRQGTRGVSGGR